MKEITRDEIPKICPDCGSKLRSYHSQGITRRVCVNQCQGFKVVVEIDHRKELKKETGAILATNNYLGEI